MSRTSSENDLHSSSQSDVASSAADAGYTGEKPNVLTRQLGVWTATFALIASMIGAGIFGLTGMIQGAVGEPLLVIAMWAVGGLVALSGALCYAELSTLMPHAGGEYTYLKNTFGLLPSFLTGWVSFFVGFAAPAAGSAMLATDYFSRIVKLVAPGSALALEIEEFWGQKLFAATIILIFTILHIFHVKKGSLVQNMLTMVKISLIVLFLGAGFAVVFTSPGGVPVEHFAPRGIRWSGLGLGLLFVMYAYSGWNGASYLAEEIQQPERNLPRALIGGTLITMVLYLILNVLYYFAVSPEMLSGKWAVGAVAAGQLFGEGVTLLFDLGFFMMLLSGISATIMIGPRVYFAMARDGLFFKWVAHVHSQFQTPLLSFVAQAVLAVFYVMIGQYDTIVSYMGVALAIFPMVSVVALMVLRHRRPDLPRPYRTPFYPLFPLIFLVLTGATVVTTFVDRWQQSAIAMGVILTGIPIFYVWMRIVHRGRSIGEVRASLLNGPFAAAPPNRDSSNGR